MTKIEKSEFHPTSNIERAEDDFHFEEIAELEPAIISLTKQLKEKIENGEYDTLISDDAGGRIPTLILRKIIKEVIPDKELRTFFIASGKTYYPNPIDDPKDYKILLSYLEQKVAPETKKALVITQYIHSGKTLIHFLETLRETGITDIDMAAVDAMPHFEREELLRRLLGKNNLYIGSREWHRLHEEHEKLGGVRKSKGEYSPFPKRMVDVIAKEGRELSLEEWREIFGIERGDSSKIIMQKSQDPEKDKEFERKTHAPLTSEETEEIQKNINFAREDTELLSQRVVRQIWKEKTDRDTF